MCRKEKFDFIFHDSCAFHGKILAEKLSVKSCGFVTSLLFDEGYLQDNIYEKLEDSYHFKLDFLSSNYQKEFLDEIKEIHKNVSQKYNVPMFPVMGSVDTSENVNIVFSSVLLQPRTFKSRNFICKPRIFMENKKDKDILKKESNLIYVSTGAYLSANSEFYNSIIGAFKDTKYNVLISLPNLDKSKVNKLPPNVKIVKQTNQLEVLGKAKIFITHGGYNGVCEAIYNRIPMLVYPLANDEDLNARIIEECGLGYNIKNVKLSKKNLLKLINNIEKDKGIFQNMTLHNNSMYNSKSISESLDEIFNIL